MIKEENLKKQIYKIKTCILKNQIYNKKIIKDNNINNKINRINNLKIYLVIILNKLINSNNNKCKVKIYYLIQV